MENNLFRNLNKLKILNVSYNKIDKIHANTFKELINLNHIFLNNNEIASLDEQLFLGLKNLKKIWLHNNNFTTDRLTLSLEQSVEFVSFKTDQTDNNSDSIDFTKFGNYKKMNPIGQGTFGTVYRVEKDNKKYALKIIPYDLKQVSSEIIALKTELKNQYIVEYIEWFLFDANTFCIVTEYCEDGDLEKKIKESTDSKLRINHNTILNWCYELLEGVSYLHSNKIIHRDIKPANILLKNGKIKLCDFGVSRELGSSIEANTHAGTLMYMSPEIRSNNPYTCKTDVWSCGCFKVRIRTKGYSKITERNQNRMK